MKVLHIISNVSPRSGGPTTVVRALSAYQQRAGMDVVVCTTKRGVSLEGSTSGCGHFEVHDDGVEYLYFDCFTALLISPQLGRWLAKHLGDFDIVHIHGLYRYPVTCAAWQARKEIVPYLIRPHGSLDPFLYKQSKHNLLLKRIYECLFDIPNLNHAAAIHYTTAEEAERAAFLGLRTKPVVVPIGIDWKIYTDLPTKGAFRGRLGVGEDTQLLLFLGRINFKKGLNLLVPAFAQVLHQCQEAILAIVGPDNEGYGRKVRSWCWEQGVQDRVLFVGHLSPEEVKQAYVDADVFVLPSYTENFGMTVVEAMACGCPVVISDQVNIWREVQQAGAGIVTTLDPKEIAEAVVRLLTDKEWAFEAGKRGRISAKERYSWDCIVDQMTDVYRELIDDVPRKRTKFG